MWSCVAFCAATRIPVFVTLATAKPLGGRIEYGRQRQYESENHNNLFHGLTPIRVRNLRTCACAQRASHQFGRGGCVCHIFLCNSGNCGYTRHAGRGVGGEERRGWRADRTGWSKSESSVSFFLLFVWVEKNFLSRSSGTGGWGDGGWGDGGTLI